MRAGIDQALGGFDLGVILNLSPPEVISTNHTEEPKKSPGGGKKEGASKTPEDLESAPTWWSSNPEKVQEWCIPAGKSYRDFFLPGKHKENFANWPSFKHHRHPKISEPRPLCIKYQSSSSCRAGCRLAHIKPSAMDPKKKESVSSRFHDIYKKT